MLFTKILWGSSALYDGISSQKNALDLRQVRRVQREGEALVCHEGRGEGDAQLLPAGGDAADQLDVACALRGQIGGLREALSGGVIELDVAPTSASAPSQTAVKSVVEAARAWKY